MEVSIAMSLKVIATAADAGVAHDRTTTAGLERGVYYTIPRAGAGTRIECMVGSELVAHLVGNIVDGKGVSDGAGEPGDAPCFEAGLSHTL